MNVHSLRLLLGQSHNKEDKDKLGGDRCSTNANRFEELRGKAILHLLRLLDEAKVGVYPLVALSKQTRYFAVDVLSPIKILTFVISIQNRDNYAIQSNLNTRAMAHRTCGAKRRTWTFL